MRVDFYHLAASPIERVLPVIAEKVLASGERLLVVAAPEQIERLDRQLWDYSPDSFLPHGRSGEPGAENQPVLLSTDLDPLNGARSVAIADGLWRDGALGFERVFYFFDGSGIDAAREAWRALKGHEGAGLHYWKQADGRWTEGP